MSLGSAQNPWRKWMERTTHPVVAECSNALKICLIDIDVLKHFSTCTA